MCPVVGECPDVVTRHERGRDEEVRGRPVARDGDVPDHCDPQQRLDIGVMRLWLERVPGEHEQVYRAQLARTIPIIEIVRA